MLASEKRAVLYGWNSATVSMRNAVKVLCQISINSINKDIAKRKGKKKKKRHAKLESLLKHIFCSLSPFLGASKTFTPHSGRHLYSRFTHKNILTITNSPNDADKAGSTGKAKVEQTYLL